MKNGSTKKTGLRILPPIFAITLLVFILAYTSGCRSDKTSPGPAALTLKTRIQSNLEPIRPELAESLYRKKNTYVKSMLDTLYADLNASDDEAHFFLALLDSHGVTITSRTKTVLSGSQNYGNYRVVANVLQKRKTFTSSLYLQGGAKVYIIGVPLIHKEKLAGVIILGIDSDFLHQSGITGQQFMSLDFNNQTNGTP
jgi:hypothetical protein